MAKGVFYNLEEEMFKAHISRRSLAKMISLSEWGFNNKMKGRSEFKLSEMEKTLDVLGIINGQKYTLEYLFKRDR